MPAQRTRYHFVGYCLDPLRGLLLDPAGAEVRLRPKPFALLSYLIEHPARVIGREELTQALWPNVAVTDDSLTQCISDLRRAFGDQAGEILRTVPRRGYMLSAAVTHEAPAEPAPARHEQQRTDATRDLALARLDTVAVHPATTIPGDEAAARVAPILDTDLITELLRFDDLRVVAADQQPLTPGFAADHGFAVHGEVRSDGCMLHVSVRVRDVVTGAFFWADRVTLPADQAGARLTTHAAALANGIDRQILRRSLRHAQQRPVESLTARQLSLIGRDLHQRGTQADTDAARDLFRRASALDPGYAPAHAWHAFTLMRVVTHGWTGVDRDQAVVDAARFARKAVEIEPESALCLSSLAFAVALQERWQEALQTARLAILGCPVAYSGTRMACAEVLAAGGEPAEAITALQDTLAEDPHCPPRVRAVLGRALVLAGRPQEAMRELRLCAMQLPEYAPCSRTMVVAAVETGQMAEARAALDQVRRLRPDWVPGGKPIFWFLRRVKDVERFARAFRIAQEADAAVAR